MLIIIFFRHGGWKLVDAPNGLGGGRFKQYVKDIINAEREPIRQIENRKAKEQEKLKLVQEFTQRVRKLPEIYRELDSMKKFRELKADYPAKDLLDVTVDKDFAQPGEYQLEVTQLAGRHSMISDGFENKDDEVGVGYFSYTLPSGDSKSVYIGPGSNTLEGIVNTINAQKGLGVTASLVNDGSGSDRPWRVVVAAKKSGMENDIEFPDFYFLDGDFRFYVDDERSAQNAIIKFNGFEIMSQANRFELLPGVTVDLKQAKEDFEFTLQISEDIPKIAAKVKALVDAINNVLDFINKQNQVDDKTDTSKTLAGDSTLFGIESRVRSWVFESFNVNDPEVDEEEFYMRLSDVGIQFEKTGMLSFKEDKFKKSMEKDYQSVAMLFAGEGNFISNLKVLTESVVTQRGGIITSRENGIRERMKRMDGDIANKEANLARREVALKRQFSNLESLMSNMQGQQQYLAQALGSPSLI